MAQAPVFSAQVQFARNAIPQEAVNILQEVLDTKATTGTNAVFDTVETSRMMTVEELTEWKELYGLRDGTRAFATDCDSKNFGETAYGGGLFAVPVYLMGGIWMIG
jgi:hypothetical protein